MLSEKIDGNSDFGMQKAQLYSHLEKVRISKDGVQQLRIVISIARDVNNVIEQIATIIVPVPSVRGYLKCHK